MAAAAACIFMSGCAQASANSRLDDLRRKLDPHVGKANNLEFARVWGPPEKRDTIGDTEYWTYLFSYGSRSSASAYPIGSGYAVASGQTIDQYDRVVLEFKGGVLTSWRAKVQR